MSNHSSCLRQAISLAVLFFLACCGQQEEPIQIVPLKPLPVYPEMQSVARQLTQVDAERRSLHQKLDAENQAGKQTPAPTEEDIHHAGELIRKYYQQIGRMPTRPEMVKLLSKKMSLASPQKAHAILDMMMLD